METISNSSLSITELANQVELPYPTVRHYLNNYKSFFPTQSVGKRLKIGRQSIEIIKFIRQLSEQGYRKPYIEKALSLQLNQAQPKEQFEELITQRVENIEQAVSQLSSRLKEREKRRFFW